MNRPSNKKLKPTDKKSQEGDTKDQIEPPSLPLNLKTNEEQQVQYQLAHTRFRENNQALNTSGSRVIQARNKYQRIEKRLVKAQKSLEDARALAKKHAHEDANALLLVPNEWNGMYAKLRSCFETEGHSNVVLAKRDGSGIMPQDSDNEALISWASCQRTDKQSGDLEEYKIALLDRLDFHWEPKTKSGGTYYVCCFLQ